MWSSPRLRNDSLGPWLQPLDQNCLQIEEGFTVNNAAYTEFLLFIFLILQRPASLFTVQAPIASVLYKAAQLHIKTLQLRKHGGDFYCEAITASKKQVKLFLCLQSSNRTRRSCHSKVTSFSVNCCSVESCVEWNQIVAEIIFCLLKHKFA